MNRLQQKAKEYSSPRARDAEETSSIEGAYLESYEEAKKDFKILLDENRGYIMILGQHLIDSELEKLGLGSNQ